MELEKLWNEFLLHGKKEIREKIIIHYLPLVRTIAGRLAIKVYPYMQQEDLESCGILGLMEAVDKFDHSLGVNFETFAYHRIRGNMLDELRRQNWLPRSLWQRQQAIKGAKANLEQDGHPIAEEEWAKAAGLTVEELRKVNSQESRSKVLSLEDEVTNGEGDVLHRGDLVEDVQSPDPLDILDQKEKRDAVEKAIETLGERDRLMLALYYQEELTLKEIGAVLEVSESRVCQLHSKVLKKLQVILEKSGW